MRLRELQQSIVAYESKASEAEEMLEKRTKDFEETQLSFKAEAQKLRQQVRISMIPDPDVHLIVTLFMELFRRYLLRILYRTLRSWSRRIR